MQHIVDGCRGEGGGVDKQCRNGFNGNVARENVLLFPPFGQVHRDFAEASDDNCIGHIRPKKEIFWFVVTASKVLGKSNAEHLEVGVVGMDEHVDHDVFALTVRFDDPGTVVPTGRKLNVVGHRMVQPIRGINACKGTGRKEFADCFSELRVNEGAL